MMIVSIKCTVWIRVYGEYTVVSGEYIFNDERHRTTVSHTPFSISNRNHTTRKLKHIDGELSS